MNFRQLEIFRAVMISGSASRASELLDITQPAVSRSIAELEASLDFALFDRIRGRLVPTPEGQLFFKDVSNSFAGLDRLRAAAARIRDFGSGSIRVASQAALGSTLVPRAIKAFREVHPNIAITLQVQLSSTVRDLVADGQFDVGLAADEIDVSGIDHRIFQSARALCAMPTGHPLTCREVITPTDLDQIDFIALSPGDKARARFDAVMEQSSVRPHVLVETPYAITVCALVAEGVGVGLVNPGSIDGFAERGVVFRPFEPGIYFRSYMLFRPDAQRSRIVKDFAAALMRARSRNL